MKPSQEFPQHKAGGSGKWLPRAILKRYVDLARHLGIEHEQRARLIPKRSGALGHYPHQAIMSNVIVGIRAGDLACAEIGVEFIEEDAGFVFGAILKCQTANALRQAPELTEEQIDRIRHRVVHLVTKQDMPREWPAYCKLLAKVGFAEHEVVIEKAVPRNWNAKRAQSFLMHKARFPLQAQVASKEPTIKKRRRFRSMPKPWLESSTSGPLTHTCVDELLMEELLDFVNQLGASSYIGNSSICVKLSTQKTRVYAYDLDNLCSEFFTTGMKACDSFERSPWQREIFLLDPLSSSLSLPNLIRLIVTLTSGQAVELMVLFPKRHEAQLLHFFKTFRLKPTGRVMGERSDPLPANDVIELYANLPDDDLELLDLWL